jgi:hypothetical protein
VNGDNSGLAFARQKFSTCQNVLNFIRPKTILPAFWDANPTSARLNAAVYIMAGICVFIIAKALKPKTERAKHGTEVV